MCGWVAFFLSFTSCIEMAVILFSYVFVSAALMSKKNTKATESLLEPAEGTKSLIAPETTVNINKDDSAEISRKGEGATEQEADSESLKGQIKASFNKYHIELHCV